MRDRTIGFDLRSSPRQTFVLFPLLSLGAAALARRRLDLRWAPLLVIGYALYRGAGMYRDAQGAGSRGFAKPPVRLVTDGVYAHTRNPMYLGHLLFCTGLAAVTRSPVAVLLLLWQYARLSERVLEDEERLARIFGDEYRDYVARVPRWVPKKERVTT